MNESMDPALRRHLRIEWVSAWDPAPVSQRELAIRIPATHEWIWCLLPGISNHRTCITTAVQNVAPQASGFNPFQLKTAAHTASSADTIFGWHLDQNDEVLIDHAKFSQHSGPPVWQEPGR